MVERAGGATPYTSSNSVLRLRCSPTTPVGSPGAVAPAGVNGLERGTSFIAVLELNYFGSSADTRVHRSLNATLSKKATALTMRPFCIVRNQA
jgi:hypothetical protein